jgi:hypothetical protein
VATRAQRFPQLFLGLVVLSVGFATGASAVGDGLEARDGQEMITVTGSARKAIVSDTVVWRASLTSAQPTPAAAATELAAWVDRVRSFLRENGARQDEVRVDPVTTATISQMAPDGRGDTGRVAGYRLSRVFEVRSSRVKEITDIVQKSDGLLGEGIPLTAEPPEYRYASLAKIRPELLAEASGDAKARGQRLVAAAGGRLGRLQSVSAGVFQITAPDSTETSGEGTYDTSTIEKDVTAVVRLTFGLR